MTLRAQRGGSRALLTIGRVQTPTLALVVMRDREIEAFKSIP
ncbi:DNA topoisomerase, partial [Xylella fastidiosa subsp. multiplex]